MPLLAGVTETTDMDALLAAGWQVDVAQDETATVTLAKAFTGATEAEALAAARAHVGA